MATSYHSKFSGTVDYIWYFIQVIKVHILLFPFKYLWLLKPLGGRHTGDLVPVRVLETLPIDILKQTGGLPNKVPFIANSSQHHQSCRLK